MRLLEGFRIDIPGVGLIMRTMAMKMESFSGREERECEELAPTKAGDNVYQV